MTKMNWKKMLALVGAGAIAFQLGSCAPLTAITNLFGSLLGGGG